jgi:hypothetical protein
MGIGLSAVLPPSSAKGSLRHGKTDGLQEAGDTCKLAVLGKLPPTPVFPAVRPSRLRRMEEHSVKRGWRLEEQVGSYQLGRRGEAEIPAA